MPCFNPIERLQSVKWDKYQSGVVNGQIASGLIIAIAVIALTIIFAVKPDALYLAANYHAIITLAIVGGISLVTFCICSCIHYCNLRRKHNEAEIIQHLDQIQKNTVNIDQSNNKKQLIICFDDNPVEYIKQVIVQPLLHEFKRAVRGVIIADCIKTGNKIGNKIEEVEHAFEEGTKLFDLFLDNPQIYVSEMLRYFGPTKKIPSVALRRLIAAYNSGNKAKIVEVQNEYEAILRSQDFTKLIAALKNPTIDLMISMPHLLEDLFSLPDEEIKKLGKNVLEYIFDKTRTNQKVLKELQKLQKKAATSSELALDLEKFIKVVLEEANVAQEKYKEWNDYLIKFMLQSTFKKRICMFLSLLSQNIRILELMFDKTMEEKRLYVYLDETSLVSESSDCIKKIDFQRDLLHLQSKLNVLRSETKKIALVALQETDPKDYSILCNQNCVIKHCFEAEDVDVNLQDLKNINTSEEVQALRNKYQVCILAVPISIPPHPFKIFKQHEGTIKFGAWLLKPFLPGLVKPRLLEILPKMEGKHLDRFDALFSTILNLLIDPIYDGAIGDTTFRETFQKIITTKGKMLAMKLEDLLLNEDHLTFERIRDEWKVAVREVAEEFEKVR